MMTEVAIIGAGPAGLAAAEILSDAGVEVTLIDEQSRAGGQIYRQPPVEFAVGDWLSDPVYGEGKALLSRVQAEQRIRWQLGTTVVGVRLEEGGDVDQPSHVLSLHSQGRVHSLRARHVLIAPGCHDLPVPLPGANLPGVMATGAIQAFLKSQQLIVGDRTVLTGTHPLQLIVADQIVQAGGRVAAVLFAQSLRNVLRAALAAPLAIAGSGQLTYFCKVLGRLRRAGVPVRFSQVVTQAHGEQALNKVSVARVGSDWLIEREHACQIDCDSLGVCFGFLASSELTRQAGVEHRWADDAGGWISLADPWFRSTRHGISVAGEITGVAGAQVAAEEGRLAALGILLDLQRHSLAKAEQLAAPIRARLDRLNRFQHLLRTVAAPPWRLLSQLQRDDVTLCKCEAVTFGELRTLLDEHATIRSGSAAKLLSRIGMGLCQGRYCNYYLTRVLSEHRGVAPATIGAFSAQLPAKPVRIGDLTDSLRQTQ